MGQFVLGILITALGVGLALLCLQTQQASRRRARTRPAFLNACKSLFSDVRMVPAATRFPRLAGRYGGEKFDIQVVPDTLTYRKLPALWVLVTLPVATEARATLNVMIRPMGIEPFSNFNRLPEQLAPPSGFPADCAIRSDDPSAAPSEDLVRRHIHVFDDPRMKELVISPKGVRLVFLAEEAQRGRYLIFRDAEMGALPLPPERLQPMLDALLALRSDIAEEACSTSLSLIA